MGQAQLISSVLLRRDEYIYDPGSLPIASLAMRSPDGVSTIKGDLNANDPKQSPSPQRSCPFKFKGAFAPKASEHGPWRVHFGR